MMGIQCLFKTTFSLYVARGVLSRVAGTVASIAKIGVRTYDRTN